MSFLFHGTKDHPQSPFVRRPWADRKVGRALTDPVIHTAISDPDDPKFDLEAFLKLSEAK